MRYCEDKHGSPAVILLCLLSVFISAAALLGLRLYASNLESRVSVATNKIEMYKDQNTLMERKRAELLSPENVYTYAQEQLNMTVAENSPVIYVDKGVVEMAKAAAVSEQNDRAGAFERFNPFVNKAHAKD